MARELAEAQAARGQAAVAVAESAALAAVQVVAQAVEAQVAAQRAADEPAVAAADAPALPQAVALTGAAVRKRTAVDTGAAKDEALLAPHVLRRAQY